MTIVTEEETESEWQKIEKTQETEMIKCDVCDHAYAKSEWDGQEMSVNPDINRQYHGIKDLSELIESYHVEIPAHVIEDGYSGTEMHFDVPPVHIERALREELNIIEQQAGMSEKSRLERHSAVKDIAEKIGTDNIYLYREHVHHFMYRLEIEASTDDHKHVCNDCYDVIFE